MKRLFRVSFFLGLLALAVWYFVLKEEHYQISFTTKQPAAIAYQHVADWTPGIIEGVSAVVTLDQERHSNITQRVEVGDSIFTYRWEFSKTKDSLTKIHVRITDDKNSFSQRLQVPFGKNAFVNRSIKNVQGVGKALIKNSEKFKVHSIKDTLFPGGYNVYLPVASTIPNKAAAMNYSIVDLMGYINEHKIKLSGPPFLEITQWNEETDEINFNFCFPISKLDSLPSSDKVLFKNTPAFTALKAEFNGNYSISDKAWYYLLEYAERNDLKVEKFPTELYLNDPHTSTGNALKWKANIYLPLAD